MASNIFVRLQLSLAGRSAFVVISAFFVAEAVELVGSPLNPGDISHTKVWLDQHLFNNTLVTRKPRDDGHRLFMMSKEKADAQGLDWPVNWPTLCFIGLGQSSIEYFVALAKLFPELQLVLLDVQDVDWIAAAADAMGEAQGRLDVGSVDDFAEARGAERRVCNGIYWSIDSPPFSFYRYRELFYSAPYVLALFSLQGCTVDTRTSEAWEEKYNCEYLYHNFQSTLCGKLNERKGAEYQGQELYFPMVDAGCGDNICMCHAHSDAFHDFHFEHLCRKNEKHRFMGQWGQDEFLIRNVFRSDNLRGKGVYVDVGSSHPFHLSNTAYLDNCLEWRGICLEPNPRQTTALQALRTCQVLPKCAWSNTTSFRFSNSAELATMTTDDSLFPSDPNSAVAGVHPADTYFEAHCSPLHDLLQEGLLKMFTAEEVRNVSVRHIKPRIDLMSVDAEGAEIEIFKDFPFEVWDIRCIVVETSRRTAMAIDSLLLPEGFVKVAVIGKDAIYLSHEQMRSFPGEGGLELPTTILWNEPGTDSDTTEYFRFQRLFGVEGDLDVDVGDQRLLNDTELERQAMRQDAKHNESLKEVMAFANSAAIGGVMTAKQQELMQDERVQQILRDQKVKEALTLLHTNEKAFFPVLKSSKRLQDKIKELVELGLVVHNATAEFLGFAESKELTKES